MVRVIKLLRNNVELHPKYLLLSSVRCDIGLRVYFSTIRKQNNDLMHYLDGHDNNLRVFTFLTMCEKAHFQ